MTQTARFHAFSNAEGPTQLNAYPSIPRVVPSIPIWGTSRETGKVNS